MITKNNAVVAIYKSHTAAEAAVKELQKSGFDMKKLVCQHAPPPGHH